MAASKEQCDKELSEALPAYNAAIKALDTITKQDITVVKGFPHPPKDVVMVMEAVCILFEQKTDWSSAKRLLNKSSFLEECKTYKKDNIPAKVLRKVAKYIANPNFKPKKLESVSTACVGFCTWVIALHTYSKVAKAIEPKRIALKKAQQELIQAKTILKEKKDSLLQVQHRVNELKKQLAKNNKKN